MQRRPLPLIALALATIALSACADVTSPTAPSQRQAQPTAPSLDAQPCGTWSGSSGKC